MTPNKRKKKKKNVADKRKQSNEQSRESSPQSSESPSPRETSYTPLPHLTQSISSIIDNRLGEATLYALTLDDLDLTRNGLGISSLSGSQTAGSDSLDLRLPGPLCAALLGLVFSGPGADATEAGLPPALACCSSTSVLPLMLFLAATLPRLDSSFLADGRREEDVVVVMMVVGVGSV